VGDTVAVLTAGTPVPLSATGEPATVTFAAMVAASVADPVAVGVNTTLMVQDPGAKVPAQVPPAVPPGLENGGVTAKLMPVALAVPLFVSVRVLDALVVPTGWFPNASDLGVTLSIATFGDWNSTAPTSKFEPPRSGRGFPK
jgi:hypothetical protein